MTQATYNLDNYATEAKKGVGYIAFVGIITSERDANGHNIIQWRYCRKDFSFEDSHTAEKEFGSRIREDVEEFFARNEEGAEENNNGSGELSPEPLP